MSFPDPGVELAPLAQQDYEDILTYGTRTWGEQAMLEYEAVLQRSFATLAAFPELGRRRPDLARDLRSHPLGEHVAFYRVTGRTVLVARILHRKTNVTAAMVD